MIDDNFERLLEYRLYYIISDLKMYYVNYAHNWELPPRVRHIDERKEEFEAILKNIISEGKWLKDNPMTALTPEFVTTALNEVLKYYANNLEEFTDNTYFSLDLFNDSLLIEDSMEWVIKKHYELKKKFKKHSPY